jgi:hypothetical protein
VSYGIVWSFSTFKLHRSGYVTSLDVPICANHPGHNLAAVSNRASFINAVYPGLCKEFNATCLSILISSTRASIQFSQYAPKNPRCVSTSRCVIQLRSNISKNQHIHLEAIKVMCKIVQDVYLLINAMSLGQREWT